MKIEITIDCPDCDGHGKTESTVGGWTAAGPWMKYVTHECHHCNGTGNESVVVDDYDTLEEARLEYTDAKMRAA
jgi:DnaJ-class molecular chaperone|tara:strand:+ start:668 stop:889 length:222 start_codon:yes stop_codon:yes gene_type:complete